MNEKYAQVINACMSSQMISLWRKAHFEQKQMCKQEPLLC